MHNANRDINSRVQDQVKKLEKDYKAEVCLA